MGVDMKSSIHQRNRDNEIYILGRREIQVIITVGPTITKGNTTPGTTITLLNKIKNLYNHYTITVMILTYLLMVLKN